MTHLSGVAVAHRDSGCLEHEGGDGDCDVCAMGDDACCLPTCAAARGDANMTLKRCARCGCAAYCCKEHQVAHWRRHKALCTVRAAVEAARRELLSKAGGGASNGDEAGGGAQ